MMLGEIHFKDYVREEENIQKITYDSLAILVDHLVDYNKSEIDSITRIINNDFANIILEKRNKIGQHISEQYSSSSVVD